MVDMVEVPRTPRQFCRELEDWLDMRGERPYAGILQHANCFMWSTPKNGRAQCEFEEIVPARIRLKRPVLLIRRAGDEEHIGATWDWMQRLDNPKSVGGRGGAPRLEDREDWANKRAKVENIAHRISRGTVVSTACELEGVRLSTYYFWSRRIENLKGF